ncbi:MAG: hypothetical protein ABJH45_19800 [Paracoccaceae bacterium]
MRQQTLASDTRKANNDFSTVMIDATIGKVDHAIRVYWKWNSINTPLTKEKNGRLRSAKSKLAARNQRHTAVFSIGRKR